MTLTRDSIDDIERFDPDPDTGRCSYFKNLTTGAIFFYCRHCNFRRDYGTMSGAITRASEHYIQLHKTKLRLMEVRK